jgi:NAD(P)-dependent dehydrogenase (short-subunit alcohol dehydrogenase family)
MEKTVLITGASTGIGYGSARVLSKAGYRVIATVRSDVDAQRLKRDLGEGVHPVLCDVTRAHDLARLPEHVARVSKNGWLDVLVNNAAIEFIAPAELQSMDDIRALFETNVFGVMSVTRTLLPLLGTAPHAKAHRGRIINISSVGGVLALPLLSAYAATKHAIEGYSHSLRRELRARGIKVIIVGPGAVKSAIWNKHLPKLYEGTPYETAMAKIKTLMATSERDALSEEAAGEHLRSVIEQPSPKARYVFTRNRLTNWTIPTMLSHDMVDRLVGGML